MPPLNYKQVSLFKDGRVVDSFRMTGVVVEIALKKSKLVGATALRPEHLPDQITLRLDGRGEKDIMVFEENRILAVVVAKALRAKLHTQGFEIQGAKVDKHDLVIEQVVDANGNVPSALHPAGLISVEIKLRRIHSQAGREKVRLALRQECEAACGWWQAIASQAQSKFCGRMILLVEFGSNGADFVTRADLKLIGKDTEFKGLWGWQGSRASLAQARTGSSSSSSQPVLVRSQSVMSPTGKRPWTEIKAKLVFRREQRKQVASVPCMYQLMGKGHGHVGEKITRGIRRHNWTSAQVFKAPRLSAKKGGSE